MVLIKAHALFALLAGVALANPVEITHEERAADLKCTVDGKSVLISPAVRDWLYPLVPHPATWKYPHEFMNLDGITWGNPRCNPAGGAQPKLLEFPIMLDAKGKAKKEVYNYKQAKPRPEPGACRIVTRKNGGDLCGVMCHKKYTTAKTKEDRFFAECK
ncbi:Ribonuclease/ribotoxin [Aspergillus pseudonomiae]|uniref:Ribonuclease/ribotoxin n=1 Tax=Aspergillus pseudonomiae TaxID=1506151 RepID=A0A5N7D7S4_9EURO|nr:Ribonuclease/ribotoxin [Aspergillus pseudonomiae]KAE8402364.1 Ribonuclease/ribotoxin [Aspergillus pseudonomiae]